MGKSKQDDQSETPAPSSGQYIPMTKKSGVANNDITLGKKKPLPSSRPPNQAPRPVDRTKNKSGRK